LVSGVFGRVGGGPAGGAFTLVNGLPSCFPIW
jgi:hypothetical protein